MQPSPNCQDAVKFLLNRQINRFLGTKIYNRDFLLDNKIKFDEHLNDEEAEFFLQMECFFKSKRFIYISQPFYIAPKNSQKQYPGAKFHNVSNEDAQIVRKFRSYFTARVNIKLKTTTGDFQILYISDERALIWKPAWDQKGGIGYQIHSYVGKLEFVAKATVDGPVLLILMGIDVRDPKDNSKCLPYWIDYTKLKVSGNVIFDKLTPIWHNKPYRYNMDVKAGEEITVQVEWLPHRGDT